MSISNDYPIVGYRFMVVLFADGIPIELRFKEVTGLKMARNINRENHISILDFELPQQTLTLKRGIVAGSDSLHATQLIEGQFWGVALLRKDLMVSVLDESGTPIKNWMIRGAYLSSVSWDGISGDSNDVLIETMEFSYHNITYLLDGV